RREFRHDMPLTRKIACAADVLIEPSMKMFGHGRQPRRVPSPRRLDRPTRHALSPTMRSRIDVPPRHSAINCCSACCARAPARLLSLEGLLRHGFLGGRFSAQRELGARWEVLNIVL